MSESVPKIADQNLQVSELLQNEEWYDLLPIEKKLIGWSLGIGVSLLVVFIVVFVFLFPAAHS
ncbi:MAG: hypothetical protein JL50_13700 [Peptococcaceae bacterium BICA1-7]|nr:MAG: hypothetical protein JL50_13700 [Peptococcaceae bacterium BICA1-7]HBV99488.1 hypothetical protein [Desulfotomaculum sp.]